MVEFVSQPLVILVAACEVLPVVVIRLVVGPVWTTPAPPREPARA
ncbi:hypothetical protein ACFFTK_07175 [Pseudonocardia petroleophila]|nr:hypothetical protein [Pseudonocardia petroleophila]